MNDEVTNITLQQMPRTVEHLQNGVYTFWATGLYRGKVYALTMVMTERFKQHTLDWEQTLKNDFVRTVKANA